MTGYLIGKVVTVSGTILISVTTTLLAGVFLFSGLAATLPIGAVPGSLVPSARSAGLLTLAVGGLVASLASVEIGHSWRHLATFGVHYQTVGYLERGEYSPSLYLAPRIAAYFEVPVEVIFSTEPSPRIGSARRSVS